MGYDCLFFIMFFGNSAICLPQLEHCKHIFLLALKNYKNKMLLHQITTKNEDFILHIRVDKLILLFYYSPGKIEDFETSFYHFFLLS